MKGGQNVRGLIRQLFLDNLGVVITNEQIDATLREAFGRRIENWHQRLSELRTDEGYTILSNRDRANLRPGQYLMETPERSATASRRVGPTRATWQAVLVRAGNSCEWNEGGIPCGLANGGIDPIGGGTVRLTPDHVRPHSIDPNSDPTDPLQWQALCGRHQVTKRNYWDGTTGKLNVIGIVQAAPAVDKVQVFRMLLAYFGYKIDSARRVTKI
jgi:hypothetical protein